VIKILDYTSASKMVFFLKELEVCNLIELTVRLIALVTAADEELFIEFCEDFESYHFEAFQTVDAERKLI
jgi:hypothetical protein